MARIDGESAEYENSLEELKSSGDLELCDQVLHEPISVGGGREPKMTLSFDVNLDSLTLELRDVQVGLFVGAHLVICGCEESNRHLLDLGDVHEGSLGDTV